MSFYCNVKLNDTRHRPESSSPPEELMDCLLPDASTSQSSVDIRGPVAYSKDQNNQNKVNSQQNHLFQVPKPIVKSMLPDQICLNSELSKFHKPSSAVIKKQLGQFRSKLNEIPNAEWKRNVDHLISFAIQQQSDIDLLRSCSMTYEQWASCQLKKYGTLMCEHANLTIQNKKMEEYENLVKKEKNLIETKNGILEKERKRFENEANDLRLFREKYKDSLKEVERLKTDAETSKKRIIQLIDEKEKLLKMSDLAKNLPKVEAERNNLKKQNEELQKKDNAKIVELEEKYNLAQKRIKVLLNDFKCEEENAMENSNENLLKQKICELEEKLEKEKKLKVAEAKTVPSSENNDQKEGLSRAMKRELSLRDAEINRLKLDCAAKAEEIIETKSQIDESKHAKMELREKLRRKKEEAQTARNELKSEREQREFLEKRLSDLDEQLQKYRDKPSDDNQKLGQKQIETVLPSNKQIKSRIREISNKKDLMEKAIDLFADKKCGKCVTLKGELDALQLKLSASVHRKNNDDSSSKNEKDSKNDPKEETGTSNVQKQEENVDKQTSNITDKSTKPKQSLKRNAPENSSEPAKKRHKKRKTSDSQQEKEGQQPSLPTKPSDLPKCDQTSTSSKNNNTSEKQKIIQKDASVSKKVSEPQRNAQPALKQHKTPEPPKPVQPSPLPSTTCQKTCEPKKDSQQTSLPSKSVKKSTTMQKSVQKPSTSSQKATEQQAPIIQKVDANSIAARIVTAFMMFIGEPCNVNNDARILIPDFLSKYKLPPDHLIGTQLAVIAEEAQKAKEESMVK